MKVASSLLAMLLFACGELAGASDLDRAREAIERIRNGSARDELIGSTRLNGFRFAQEVPMPDGRMLLIVSREDGGALILYSARGALLGLTETARILSIQLVHLNNDDTPELVTEQLVGRGTGVRDQDFVVYRVDAGRMVYIWRGEALVHRSPALDGSELTQRIGFVHCFEGMFGEEPKLVHVTVADARLVRREEYVMRSAPAGPTLVRKNTHPRR